MLIVLFRRPVVFYNSLGHERQSVVRLYVNSAYVEVTDPSGKVIPTQVDPFWLNNEEMADDIFKVKITIHEMCITIILRKFTVYFSVCSR